MNHQCTEQRFLEDIAQHQMTILWDDGVNRHVRFSIPDSSNMRFDLITWPGYLCYTGDMGSFVFRRLKDMFVFFRTDREHMHLRNGETLAINPRYWGEKLEAVDRYDGFKEFSADKFRSIVNRLVDDHIEEREWPVAGIRATSLRDAVHEEVLSRHENGYEAHNAASGFEHDGFEFSDFWEQDLTDYSFRFIWCCYALAWGVQQYDSAKEQVEVAA